MSAKQFKEINKRESNRSSQLNRQNSWKDLKTPADEEVKDSDSKRMGCPYNGMKVKSQEKEDSDNDPNEKILKRNSQDKLNED